MTEKVKAEYFPWLIGREHPDVLPAYKIVARAMNLYNDSIVMIHRAGSIYVENYYVKDIVNNDALLAGLDRKEAELLKWVIESEKKDPLEEIRKK